MNWHLKPIFFPVDRLSPEYVALYLERYSVDVSEGEHFLDGVPVTLSPTEHDSILATVFPDNKPLTMIRNASLPIGTLVPIPEYSEPLDEDGWPVEGATLLGYVLLCGWPEAFIADLYNPDKSPEEALLFDGVQVL